MGNDGGSIPKRSELVKQKAKKEKQDENLKAIARWFYCALSKKELSEPIVADELGKLYNKEAIIEYLLDPKEAYGDADKICNHVKSLKDVKVLKLLENPERNHVRSKTDDPAYTKHSPLFICPILQKEMNGRNGFVFIWDCGCVVSKEAVKMMGGDTCLNCGKQYEKENIIKIYPAQEELQEAIENMKMRREKRKMLKKKNKESLKDSKKILKDSSKSKEDNVDKSTINNTSSDSTNDRKKRKEAYLETKSSNKKRAGDRTIPSQSINSTVPASRIIEQYSIPVNQSLKQNSAVLNSIFLSEADKKRNDDNKNYLFKGTFNRYVA
ncbi:hypothetical protein BB558_000799 [Smittium angustum]|uniref:Uncharacterized protein n=1 Tax=Smittium angustum TaxID=133377 RepID=A0A2U1IWH2_SMIAN|nr:hypothetical protein BB558_006993 [Smittium angustum]PWA03012.1 hypothetical protein BB558_000799 [Smittium angustum]